MPASIDLADLNGSNGFVLNGIDRGDLSGWSVSNAGDVNGDGIDDLIIGAYWAAPNGKDYAGESYLVFGGNNIGNSGSFELDSLNGSNGFVINGINPGNSSGGSVSNAGDVNGDGFDDFIIGAQSYGYHNVGISSSFLIFGGSDLGDTGSLELSSLDGTNGFFINSTNSYDYSGVSVSNAGDVNGDGFDDLIIGARFADTNGKSGAGESYVVFGGSSLGNGGSLELSELDGTNGFVMSGIDSHDNLGRSISNAGDINSDGIDDLIIGASGADPNGKSGAGESYVVFGDENLGNSGSLELSELDGTNGFVINGISRLDRSGWSVSNTGDINGDGIDDLIIGLGEYGANESYVVFGGSNVSSNGSIELSELDGTNGFVIKSTNYYDNPGSSVSNAGDINGDGINDLILGAPRTTTGESYIIFGGNNLASSGSFELSDLNGTNGFILNGIDKNGYSGNSVSNAGDINGDGIDDVIIGAPKASPNDKSFAGESYVVFGSTNIFSNFANGTDGDDYLEGPFKDNEIFALAGNDTVKGSFDNDTIDGGTGNDSLSGNDGDDNILGGEGNDTIEGQGNNDSLDGGFGDDLILGDNGNDNISGGEGNDTIFGGPDNDVLKGNTGNDLIFGDEGDDILSGGKGLNTLWGGAGADTFVINRGENSTIIKDYVDGEDQIQLDSSLTFDDLTFVENDDAIGSYSVELNPLVKAKTFDLDDLDGSNGFIVSGINRGDKLGLSVNSAGDINGDGIDDLILAAPRAYSSTPGSGEVYVVFGTTESLDTELDLNTLDGRNGFVISGIHFQDISNSSVNGVGDINGDGIDDLMVAANRGSYVVFGTTQGFDEEVDLTNLDASNGFAVPAVKYDFSEKSVSSAGDINGDGFDDLIVGAPGAGDILTITYGGYYGTYYSYESDQRGNAYLVFGTSQGFDEELDLTTLDGSNGFTVKGLNRLDSLGQSVSSAGDINGDGFDDLIIGAPGLIYGSYTPTPISTYSFPAQRYSFAGQSYVIFGSNQDFDSELDLTTLNGSNGFVISAPDEGGNLGRSVSSAGDINGDGIDDLIIGAPDTGYDEYSYYADLRGKAYVVFGTTESFDSQLDLSTLDGSNGFSISGIDEGDFLGSSVSSAGDFNGDGFDDLIVGIGAPYADSRFYPKGEAYLIFGKNENFDADLDLKQLDVGDGLVIINNLTEEKLGSSVSSAGDVNGDGLDDLIIGEPGAVNVSSFSEGKAYIIFGFNSLDETTENTKEITGTNKEDILSGLEGNDSIKGLAGDDTIFGATGNDTLRGNNGNDNVFGGEGNDTIWGQADNDSLAGASGQDLIKGNNGNDTLIGGSGNDTLFGGENNDFLFGNTGNDSIFGNAGDDYLVGGKGLDTLVGGKGLDTLVGGAGADTFVINRGENTTRIKDYVDGVDKIQLGSSLTFNDLTFVQNGDNSQIRYSENNGFLAAVENTSIGNFGLEDFV